MAAPHDDRTAEEVADALATALPRHGFWEWPAVVGVSGGADSVALLTALVAVVRRGREPCRLIAAHAHHGLRPEADGDLEFVEQLASRLGVEFVSVRLDVGAAGGGGGEGLEARARRLRYDWLGRVAHQQGARHVLVAHTADDQAETILHRVLRGTGIAGLSGMRPARRLVDGVALLRPLLGVRRATLRRFLVARGQAWREDDSNADIRFARAFLRSEVIPRVEQGPWPAATEALLRLGQQSALVAGALESAVVVLVDRHVQRLPDGSLHLDAVALARLDGHLLAECFATLWRREAWPQRDMTAGHYRQLVSLLRAAERTQQAAVCFPGGVRAVVASAGRELQLIRRESIDPGGGAGG